MSGIDFFSVDGVIDREDARDVKLLGALQAALDKLAGPDFAPAFAGSGKQHDYRWGRLHTIVLNHPFVPEFDIPSAISGFPPPFDDLQALSSTLAMLRVATGLDLDRMEADVSALF